MRLVNQAAWAAATTPSAAERRLRAAEKVVYRTSRREASATTFGLAGRIIGSLVALTPGTALGVHAFLNRTEAAVLIEVLLGVVPVFAIAALMLYELWRPAKKAERILQQDRL